MKRLIAVILLVSVLCSICGCKPSEPDLKEPVNFYYRRSNALYGQADAVVACEQREALGHREDLSWLITSYFSGARADYLQTPFPKGTSVQSWKIQNSTLDLLLSKEFGQLRGIDLTVACSCIATTFLELTEVSAVVIRAEDALLHGQEEIRLGWEDLHLSDYDVQQNQENLTVYYADRTFRYLIGKNIAVNTAAVGNIYTYLFEQLLLPPQDSGLLSPIPEGTQLLGISVRDGVCSVDLSADFVRNGPAGAVAQRCTLLAIVNTLTQLPDIDRVEFYQNNQLMTNYNALTLNASLEFDATVIGPVMTGLNEMDMTIYLPNGATQNLAGIPVRIRRSVGSGEQDLLLQALISYEARNGYTNPIPNGTKVLSTVLTDELCVVNLSQEFIGDSTTVVDAVRSIVASLCGLEGISCVQVLVEGASPSGYDSSLFQPMVPDESWYLS